MKRTPLNQLKTSSSKLARAVWRLVLRNIIPTIAILLFAGGAGVYAAFLSPAPPSSPTSQTYTLQQICDHLSTGVAVSPMNAFTEPATGPASTMCTLNQIMALAPGLDTTNGATTADVANGKTFWGIRSGAGRGPQTGTAPPLSIGLVPKTGQTTSYATGDDGDKLKGQAASPRFTDNANGTVTDNLTSLIWLKNANCYSTQTWAQAITDANGLATGSCGLTDGSSAGQWRLPNITELSSLVDLSKASGPMLPTGHPFTSASGVYWSSTTDSQVTTYAWYVDFGDGSFNNPSNGYPSQKSNVNLVWPVRGGQ